MSPAPPHALIEIAIEPKSTADRAKLVAALDAMTAKDSSLSVQTDEQTGQTILGGHSELHLDRAVNDLRALGVEVNIGAPQVAYRESLGCAADVAYTHKRVIGAAGQFALIKIHFEPGPPGSGALFENALADGALPSEFVGGVIQGLAAAKDMGLIAGFPLIDFKATLYDGVFHDVDSSERAFEIAARSAFRELREKGAPKLLEPIMKVEVVTPEDYLDDVICDLNSRRGQVELVDQRGADQAITALVPLANMFGYLSNLRDMSQGRAQFTMQYDHYQPLPEKDDPELDPYSPAAAMRA